MRGAVIFLISAFIFGYTSFVFASETNGTIDTTNKYAWGKNIGWINFGCDNCNVAITDSAITGNAWSSNFGWINLNPTNAGVLNTAEGTLSGHAWSSNLGWIDFTGVTISTAGEFLGYASVDSNASQISFNCVNGLSCASSDFKVKTDWRPASSRTVARGSSGSRSRPPVPPAVPPIFPPVLPPITSPIPVIPPGLTANAIDVISDLLANLFRRNDAPLPPVEVPETAPLALSAAWNILPEQSINSFIFAPLPYELRILASKFPELGRTFQEVGIERFSDVQKLAGVNLNIPGLGDILNNTIKTLSSAELAELGNIGGVKLNIPGLSGASGTLPKSVGAGRIALIEGLPVAKFSLSAKKDLPSEFVFARGAGELVDFNVALSVAETGTVTQRMSALPGKTLKLVVKPISRARSITGYIVFVAPTPRITKNEILRSSLTASALFSMSGLVENIPANSTYPLTPSRREGENSKALSFWEGVGGVELNGEGVGGVIPVEKKLVLSSFEYEDPDRDGIYTADVAMPVTPGEYEVITVIDYIDPELGSRKMSLVTVIDPEGYIYEKNNGKETRIPSAIVSLYKLNTATKNYELWNAKDYQQENPQITDVRGTYAFLVPAGTYYFQVEAPGYRSYEGKAFIVAEGNGIHQNIELESANKWAIEPDWQTVLLIVVLLLLVYNPVVRFCKKLYYRV